jgi:hypothetical protein
MSAEHQTAIAEWFAAHYAYHKASDIYNARLAFVRAERERDPACLSMTCDQEYKALGDAERAATWADEVLYNRLVKIGTVGASATGK